MEITALSPQRSQCRLPKFFLSLKCWFFSLSLLLLSFGIGGGGEVNGKETQNRMTAAKVGVGKGKREDGICVRAAQLTAECEGKSMKGKCLVL